MPSEPNAAWPDAAPGPGYWQASDGNWYPPESHPQALGDFGAQQYSQYEPPAPGYWQASDGNWYPPDSHPYAAGGYHIPGIRSRLPQGVTLSSKTRRFWGSLLGTLLIIVTLGIGYLIWAFIVYQRGQTPAKQLMNMYVIDENTGQIASWSTMFLRGFVIDGLLGQVTGGIFTIISALWIFSGDSHQRLTDKMVNTIVVDSSYQLHT